MGSTVGLEGGQACVEMRWVRGITHTAEARARSIQRDLQCHRGVSSQSAASKRDRRGSPLGSSSGASYLARCRKSTALVETEMHNVDAKSDQLAPIESGNECF